MIPFRGPRGNRPLTFLEHLRIGSEEPHYKGGVTSMDALPTASVQYRRMLVVVEGATGATDTLYTCLKAAANTYSWVQITTGG